MSARDKIYAALRQGTKSLGEQGAPLALPVDLYRNIAADESPARLLDIFIERLTSTGGEALPLVARQDAASAIRAFIEKEGAASIIADDEVAVLLGLPADAITPEFMRRDGRSIPLTPASAAGKDDSFAAALGITMAQMAVAETGTVVIHYGPGRARLASLSPPLHLAVLPVERLVPDLIDAAGDFGEGSGAVWITGPSKTADIGGILVRGIHGPGRIVVLPIK